MKSVNRVLSMSAAILRLYIGVVSVSRARVYVECIIDCLAAKLPRCMSGPWGTISDMKGLRRTSPLLKDVLGEILPVMFCIVARLWRAFISPSVGRMDTTTSLADIGEEYGPSASRRPPSGPWDDTRAPERRRTGEGPCLDMISSSSDTRLSLKDILAHGKSTM